LLCPIAYPVTVDGNGFVGRRERSSGEHAQGRGPVKDLVEGWDLELDAAEARSAYSGRPGRKPVKLVHNIVLSMPAGTSAKGVLAASRAFARKQFALKNRYAMVLHTDQPHPPHVHLVVKAMGEQGGAVQYPQDDTRRVAA
jgi:hypothetical protein